MLFFIVFVGGFEREVVLDCWDVVVRVVNVIEFVLFFSSGVVLVEVEGDFEGLVVVFGFEKGGCVVEVGVLCYFFGWLVEFLDEGY